MHLLGNVDLEFDGKNTSELSNSAIVERVLAGFTCSDRGSGLDVKFGSVHVDEMASTSLTCECEPNVRTHKKAKVVSFDGTTSDAKQKKHVVFFK